MSDFPQLPPFLREMLDRVRSAWDSGRERMSDFQHRRPGADSADTHGDMHWVRWVAAALLFLVLVYYPVGMALYHDVDDTIDFKPGAAYTVEGGSKAVSVAAALVAREAAHWSANKPFWHPAAALDNMPNYQLGIVYAVARFAVEMGDYLGRVRGSSAIDPNLDRAAGLLKYDGRIWYWGQGNFIPMAKAESQYRQAVEALVAYNKNVAAGHATFERRADNLISFLDRVAADLGSASAALESRTTNPAGYFDTQADDLFYDVKGKLYAYYLILNAMGEDYANVINEKQAGPIWTNVTTSLRTGAEMDPLIVTNGKQDSLLVPSHLSSLGFSLLRARTQLRELGDALQK